MKKLYKNWLVHNIIAHPLMQLIGFLNENAEEFADYLEQKEIEGSESYVIIDELSEALEVRCESA